MTVSELIAELQKFDPSLPVLTPGFDESGYDLAGVTKKLLVKRSRESNCLKEGSVPPFRDSDFEIVTVEKYCDPTEGTGDVEVVVIDFT